MVGVLVRSSFFSGIPAGSRDVLMTTRQPDFLSFETWLVLFPLDGVVSVGTAFSDGPYSHILLVSWHSCSIQVLHGGLGAVGVGLCLNSCCRFLSLPSLPFPSLFRCGHSSLCRCSLQGPSGSFGNCASFDALFLGPCVGMFPSWFILG